MKNIALIGFMACGKSTIGKAIAHENGFSFIDTDTEIERAEKRSVSEIFDSDGEDYFRTRESEILKLFSKVPHSVISTGGGIITRPENIEALKETCFTVFLDIPFEILAKRAEGTGTRPLFRDREAAYELWKKRYKLYCDAADMIYNSHDSIVLKSARHITEAYRTFLKKCK